MFQGYGRLDLSRSLPLHGDNMGWKLQVKDLAKIKPHMETKYEVFTTGLGPLIVVLTWYDPPGHPAAMHSIVNDLDLKVEGVEEGDVWTGNRGHVPRDDLIFDKMNTVEKVYIAKPKNGTYIISVLSSLIFGKTFEEPYQNFSLAVLGGLTKSGRLVFAGTKAISAAQKRAAPSDYDYIRIED
eukprot:gene23190-30402_t